MLGQYHAEHKNVTNNKKLHFHVLIIATFSASNTLQKHE